MEWIISSVRPTNGAREHNNERSCDVGLFQLEKALPELRRHAYLLSLDPFESDQLVQDCVLRAIFWMHTLCTEDALRPWLFRVMHNLYLGRGRRMGPRKDIAATRLRQLAFQSMDPDMRTMFRGLARLPDGQRSVLLLVVVEGFQHAKVAKILGLSIETVMWRFGRARERMGDFVDMERANGAAAN